MPTQELIYTSARKGVKPGTRGFCTVAHTRGMNPAAIRLLESLSAYRGMVGKSPQPAAISHLRAQLQGDTLSILSRVAPCRGEHTNRDNKLAHHLILDREYRPACGPARLAALAIFRLAWEQAPQILAPLEDLSEPPDPTSDSPSLYAKHWEQAAGDPGWAGVLARNFAIAPGQTVYIVAPPETAMLPLLTEAMALIPREKRWLVTFTTHFSGLPPTVACLWRGCLPELPQLKDRGRANNCLIVDLTKPLGSPPNHPEVEQARGKVQPPESTAARPASAHPAPAAPVADSGNRAGDTVRVEHKPRRPKLRLSRSPKNTGNRP